MRRSRPARDWLCEAISQPSVGWYLQWLCVSAYSLLVVAPEWGHGNRLGLGWSSGSIASASQGMLGRGPGHMEKGCFRVSPIGTDVTGIVVRPAGAVCRCVSAADTSLSLSLSLYSRFSRQKPSSGAGFGALHDRLAGNRRALASAALCCVGRSRILAVSAKLGRSPRNPGEAIKGAWALAPSRARFPGRRGSTDLGPRRPPMTTRSGASLRPRSLVCVAHFAHCVLDLLAPCRHGGLLRPGDCSSRGGGC
jgi:hypothetical protein